MDCRPCHCVHQLLTVSRCNTVTVFRMDMIVSAGKSRKNVDAYVMLTPDAKTAVDILNEYRMRSGIPETNEYIFARRTHNSPMSGNTELKEIVESCPGLQSPDRITSTSLRKYIATVSQVPCK